MRKKISFYIGLILVVSISGCAQAKNILPTMGNESSIMRDENVGESDDKTVTQQRTSTSDTLYVSDESLETEKTTADVFQDSMIKNELIISDIFIPEDECLKHTPFMSSSVECVLQYNPNLERVKSEEGANGYFNYWKGDGIEYVTYNEDLNME